METLNDLETTLLQGLTEKYPPLSPHISFLKVKDRMMTKTGMQVNFEYDNSVQELTFEDINALFSNGENIQLKGLKHGLGYVIDVTGGQIIHLELVTYGENWNGKTDDFRIVTE